MRECARAPRYQEMNDNEIVDASRAGELGHTSDCMASIPSLTCGKYDINYLNFLDYCCTNAYEQFPACISPEDDLRTLCDGSDKK